MTADEPLSANEEAVWRALMRIVKVLPRHLDNDLVRGAGLTASEYTTIMHLSEAPNRELRMADLATATDLSASRMTRLVDDLQSRGFVTRPRAWRSSTRRVIRLADKSVALARSAIRNSRLGASERCMIVVYSLAVRPAPRTRSLSRCRGSTLTIRISARQAASSLAESGSTVAMLARILA